MDTNDNPEAGKQTQLLADLPLTADQAEETKAGTGTRDYNTVTGRVTSIAVDE